MGLSTTYTKAETDYLLQQIDKKVVEGYKGDLRISDPAPTEIGYYILLEVGTYTNLGGIVVSNNNLNFASFDGITWSKVEVAMPEINDDVSDNLITLAKKINGYYIYHSNGNLIGNGMHTTTDYIELLEGERYELGEYFDNTFFAFYDENKNYISDTRSHDRIFSFALPENAKYIRVSYLTTNELKVYLKRKQFAIIYDWGVNILPNYKLYIDKFINQNNGGIADVSNFAATDFIPVIPNRWYSQNINNYNQYAFYDENFKYIVDTQSSDGKKVFKIPVNARFIRISVNTWESNNYLKLLNPKFGDKIIEVGKQITDFATIQSAINYANSTNQSHTIKISNGVYLEALEVKGTVAHSFIGASKTETIISDVNDSDQKWEALQTNGGYFENIFFRQKGGGYAVHCDYAKEGVIEFFNCRMETAYGSAIGCGAQPNQTLKFRNCQIIQLNAPAGSGIMYWHNAVNSSVVGQRLEMWHCEIFGNERALRIDDANQIYGDGNMPLGNAKCLFVGNNFFSGWYQKELDLRNGGHPTASGAIIGNIVIDERSYGNNVSELNK